MTFDNNPSEHHLSNAQDSPASNPDMPIVVMTGGQPLTSLDAGAPGEMDDPLLAAMTSLANTVAFSPADWAADRRSAWIYGIVLGWCEEDDLCTSCDPVYDFATGPCVLSEFEEEFGWGSEGTERLRQHRAAWKERAGDA